jgi:hypothetical protein
VNGFELTYAFVELGKKGFTFSSKTFELKRVWLGFSLDPLACYSFYG